MKATTALFNAVLHSTERATKLVQPKHMFYEFFLHLECLSSFRYRYRTVEPHFAVQNLFNVLYGVTPSIWYQSVPFHIENLFCLSCL